MQEVAEAPKKRPNSMQDSIHTRAASPQPLRPFVSTVAAPSLQFDKSCFVSQFVHCFCDLSFVVGYAKIPVQAFFQRRANMQPGNTVVIFVDRDER